MNYPPIYRSLWYSKIGEEGHSNHDQTKDWNDIIQSSFDINSLSGKPENTDHNSISAAGHHFEPESGSGLIGIDQKSGERPDGHG